MHHLRWQAWPPHDWEGPIAPHHISDAHIYSERVPAGVTEVAEEKVPEEAVPEVEVTEEAEEEEEAEAEEEPPLSYFATWPVPLHTSKQV